MDTTHSSTTSPFGDYPIPVSITEFAISTTELGSGNFSTVFRARHKKSNIPVAIKRVQKATINRLLKRHPNAKYEALQEKSVGLLLQNCQYVVKLLLTLQDTESLYYIYELLDGGELWTVYCTKPFCSDIIQHPRVPTPIQLPDAINILKNITYALAELHSFGIAHRDLKPENIVFTQDRKVLKLIDFGTSKDLFISIHNSRTEFIGTPEYMSPEAIDNKIAGNGIPTDTCTDLWSLGIIAYQLLTGITPFKANSPYASLLKIARYQKKEDEGEKNVLFPPCFPKIAYNFITSLLVRDRKDRIGVLDFIPRNAFETLPTYAAGYKRNLQSCSTNSKNDPNADKTLPSNIPCIDYMLILNSPLLSTICSFDEDLEYIHKAVSKIAILDDAKIIIVESVTKLCLPSKKEFQLHHLFYAWHILTLHKRSHVPIALLQLLYSLPLQGFENIDILYGIARCLRLLAYEQNEKNPCILGQHNPREYLGWNIIADFAYVSKQERNNHWSSWHCQNNELKNQLWDIDNSHEEVNEKGWMRMETNFMYQPYIKNSNKNPIHMGFYFVYCSNICVKDDTLPLLNFLEAIATLKPQPRAIIFCGYLSYEYYQWNESDHTSECDWVTIRKQIQKIVLACGEVTRKCTVSGVSAPPILFANTECIDNINSVYFAEEDSFYKHRELSHCIGSWLTGVRLLFLDSSDLSLYYDDCKQVMERRHCPERSFWPSTKLWLKDAVDLSKSAAQHILVFLRDHPKEKNARESVARFIGATELGARAIFVPPNDRKDKKNISISEIEYEIPTLSQFESSKDIPTVLVGQYDIKTITIKPNSLIDPLLMSLI